MKKENKDDGKICGGCELYRSQGWGMFCKKCRDKNKIPKEKFDEALDKLAGIGKGKI